MYKLLGHTLYIKLHEIREENAKHSPPFLAYKSFCSSKDQKKKSYAGYPVAWYPTELISGPPLVCGWATLRPSRADSIGD